MDIRLGEIVMKTNYCIAVFVVLAALLGSVFFVEGYADEADATTSGDDGDIHWEISDGTLTITKKEGATSGKMKDYNLRGGMDLRII